MPEEVTLSRTRRKPYKPAAATLSLLRVSGNPINGLGETTDRRASPFFWHPPDQHPYGELQLVARQNSRKCPGSTEAFAAAYNHPPLSPVAEHRNNAPAEQLASEVKSFALSHEADAVGIASMDPLYVFEGYTIAEPWVIVLALAHNYERLRQVPSDETNGIGVCDIGDQYARGTRSSYALANWIRSQGYNANAFPGPMADALLLIPPAIASGLGELGKHGSLISPQFGSGVRLAGVTTDMPLVATTPIRFGADDFCQNLPGLHQCLSTRRHPGTEANRPRHRALVCRLRQMHPVFRRGRLLRHLHRDLPLDQPGCPPQAPLHHGKAVRLTSGIPLPAER